MIKNTYVATLGALIVIAACAPVAFAIIDKIGF
jgi:hypothetical protein